MYVEVVGMKNNRKDHRGPILGKVTEFWSPPGNGSVNESVNLFVSISILFDKATTCYCIAFAFGIHL